MTQDEIIKLAKAYGFTGGFDADGKLLHDEAFVVAVAEAVDREREACAKVCEEISLRASGIHDAMTDDRNDEPILYMTGKELGSKSCADAIRARAQADRGEA